MDIKHSAINSTIGVETFLCQAYRRLLGREPDVHGFVVARDRVLSGLKYEQFILELQASEEAIKRRGLGIQCALPNLQHVAGSKFIPIDRSNFLSGDDVSFLESVLGVDAFGEDGKFDKDMELKILRDVGRDLYVRYLHDSGLDLNRYG